VGVVHLAALALAGCSSQVVESDSQDISQSSSDVTILKIEPMESWLHVRSGKAIHDG
jgi:hypothetical protein